MTNTPDYAYVPDHDELAAAVETTISLPLPELRRIIRHELTSAEAVAALVVLVNRAQSERTVITYRDYLTSDTWQEKRRSKFDQVGRRCERCGSTDRIQVHHQTYERLGHELLSDLEVLCGDCHKAHHRANA